MTRRRIRTRAIGRGGRSVRTLLLVLLAANAACSAIAEDQAPPKDAYAYYSGTKRLQGDAWVRITTFARGDDGTNVVLVPMVHIAEAQFFRQVQAEMDAADVVLLEGVGGSPSLGPMKLLTTYLFSNYPRFASHAGVAEQGEVVVPGENAKRGDLTLDEFREQMPWYAPVVQLAVFPILVVASELHHVVAFTMQTLSKPLFLGDSFEAGYRHFLYSNLFERDDDGDGVEWLMPGILHARNARLLEAIDAEAARTDGRSARRIVVPWGAAHMRGLESDLLARGWVIADQRWVVAVKVKRLHDGVTPEDEDRAFDVYLPYALQWRSLDAAWSLSLLFQSILVEHDPTSDDHVSLLWDLLFHYGQDERADAASWQILPSLFDHPILFAWRREGEAGQVRFLLVGRWSWGQGTPPDVSPTPAARPRATADSTP